MKIKWLQKFIEPQVIEKETILYKTLVNSDDRLPTLQELKKFIRDTFSNNVKISFGGTAVGPDDQFPTASWETFKGTLMNESIRIFGTSFCNKSFTPIYNISISAWGRTPKPSILSVLLEIAQIDIEKALQGLSFTAGPFKAEKDINFSPEFKYALTKVLNHKLDLEISSGALYDDLLFVLETMEKKLTRVSETKEIERVVEKNPK